MKESTRRAKRRDVAVIIDVRRVICEGLCLRLCDKPSAVGSVCSFAMGVHCPSFSSGAVNRFFK